jgi:hypothetical protein
VALFGLWGLVSVLLAAALCRLERQWDAGHIMAAVLPLQAGSCSSCDAAGELAVKHDSGCRTVTGLAQHWVEPVYHEIGYFWASVPLGQWRQT